MGSPVKNLANSIFFYRGLSRKRIDSLSYQGKLSDLNGIVDEFSCSKDIFIACSVILSDLFEAHNYLRSPKRVEFSKLFDTSQKRFLKILDGFPTLEVLNGAVRLGEDHIRKELSALLRTNKNNVVLVVFQAFFAVPLKWNASRILLRAREGPEEWIRFVGAEDGELFIG